MLRGSSASDVFQSVLPKGDPSADDKGINLKPSVRNGSTLPPSAPACESSMLCGSSACHLFATTSAFEISPPVPPKDDTAVGDKDITLKPSARSESSSPPSALIQVA
jgi:hypothetical protein